MFKMVLTKFTVIDYIDMCELYFFTHPCSVLSLLVKIKHSCLIYILKGDTTKVIKKK